VRFRENSAETRRRKKLTKSAQSPTIQSFGLISVGILRNIFELSLIKLLIFLSRFDLRNDNFFATLCWDGDESLGLSFSSSTLILMAFVSTFVVISIIAMGGGGGGGV
jgi:hypothetical protein